MSATASPPALVLSTQAAFTVSDNSQANWQAGTLTNLDANTYSPSLALTLSSSTVWVSGPSQSGSGATNSNYTQCWVGCHQSVTTTSASSQSLSSIGILVCQGTASNLSTTVSLYSDNNGLPGSLIATGSSISNSGIGNCGSASSFLTSNFTPVTLSPSTKYWVNLDAAGSISNYFGWLFPNNGGSLTSYTANIQIPSTVYNSTSGAITSRVFDAGTSTQTWLFNWGTFNTVETDNGQSIVYETQVSSSATGPWDAPVAVTPGGTIGSANKEFIQYIATFSNSGNASQTPILSSVTINTTVMEASSGSFISQPWNVGSPISWGNFPIVESLNSGNIAFSICSSSNITMSPNRCVAQNPNTQILVATNTYVQWYATFTVTAATQTPTLQSGTVQWYTGGNQPPMASTVWDNRYWLSLTTNSVDTANDAVMVLNKSGAWSQFDIHAGAFTQYKNTLYHADSLPTGNIYLDNQGWSDNGAAINAFLNTRNESLGDLSSDDYMYALYPTAMATGNCPMTVQYSVDNSTTAYSLGSPLLSEFNTITSVRLPFPIDSTHQDFGQSVDFTLGTDDGQCGWQFLGIEGLYKQRPIQ